MDRILRATMLVLQENDVSWDNFVSQRAVTLRGRNILFEWKYTRKGAQER